MTAINVQPVIDAVGGTASTAALFTAEARRAGRGAVRVTANEVTFPTRLECRWNGSAWDTEPKLDALDVDCYWHVVIRAAGTVLSRDVIVPSAADAVDFADLQDVIPDTAEIDTRIQQWNAVQQNVTGAVAQVTQIRAQVSDTEATLQALIGQANALVQAASAVTAANLIDGNL